MHDCSESANLRRLGQLLEGCSDAAHQLGALCCYAHLHSHSCLAILHVSSCLACYRLEHSAKACLLSDQRRHHLVNILTMKVLENL